MCVCDLAIDHQTRQENGGPILNYESLSVSVGGAQRIILRDRYILHLGMADTPKRVHSTNLFVYCDNNDNSICAVLLYSPIDR